LSLLLLFGFALLLAYFALKQANLENLAPTPCAQVEMFAACEKCLRPTFAPEEKMFAPYEKCSRLLRNVCGL
jgi:hypothetical protein